MSSTIAEILGSTGAEDDEAAASVDCHRRAPSVGLEHLLKRGLCVSPGS